MKTVTIAIGTLLLGLLLGYALFGRTPLPPPPPPTTSTTLPGPMPGKKFDFEPILILVEKANTEAGCKATFRNPAQKNSGVIIHSHKDGAIWQVKNKDCSAGRLTITPTTETGKLPLPGHCVHSLKIPDFLEEGETVRLTCAIPKARPKDTSDPDDEGEELPQPTKYHKQYFYLLKMCNADESVCFEADPELDFRRN